MTGETEQDHVQQEDCEGEGDENCQCYTCLNLCCPNCRELLAKKQVGDEFYDICLDCGYVEE